MSEIKNNQNSLNPYSERSGVGVDDSIEAIFSSPEVLLTDEEKKEAQAYAQRLFEISLDSEYGGQLVRSLEEIYQTDSTKNAHSFYLGYFRTSAGKQNLQEHGIRHESEEELASALDNVDFIKSIYGDDELRKLAVDSLNWYKDELAKQLMENPDEDKNFSDENPLIVNYDPDDLINKLWELQSYRTHYRSLRRELNQEPHNNLTIAKSALLSVYTARVNEMTAGLYPPALDLAQQLKRAEAAENIMAWQERLDEVASVAYRAVTRDRNNLVNDLEFFKDNLARRLDFLKYGAAWDEDGILSPVSQELEQLVQELADEQEPHDGTKGSLDQEQIELLDRTFWNSDQVKDLLDTVVEKWDLLSGAPATWQEVAKRDGYAPDGKWQIVISPEKKSFAVNSSKRVLWVPETFNRSLTQESPAGALPVIVHELTHLLQAEFDYKLAEQIPLAKIKGRRSSALLEAGTINEERKLHAIFGRTRTVNTHYLRALQVKLAGGNKLEVARAFYSSYISGKSMSDEALKKARDLSVDRSLRFYRSGGYSSKSLAYIEQELIAREMSKVSTEWAEAVFIAGSSFNLQDSARLHRAGLLNLPESVGFNPTGDVWEVFMKKYFPSLN